MSYAKEFVNLDKSIHEELNAFIRTQAAKHMKAGISKTIVLPASVSLPNGKTPIAPFIQSHPAQSIEQTYQRP